jgi:hypothetical protein
MFSRAASCATRMYRLRVDLTPDEDDSLRIHLYASEAILNGYVPRVGDDAGGVFWMQGRLVQSPDGPGEAGAEG